MKRLERWKKVVLALGILSAFLLALWTGPTTYSKSNLSVGFQRFSMPAEHLVTVALGRDKSPYFQDRLSIEAVDLQRALEALDRDYSLLGRENESRAYQHDHKGANYRLSYVLPIAYKNLGGLQEVKLNKGSRHGLAEGMSVLSSQGYLGRLTFVDAYYSYLTLASDPRFGYTVENMKGDRVDVYGQPYEEFLRVDGNDETWIPGEPVFIQKNGDTPSGIILGNYQKNNNEGFLKMSADSLRNPVLFVLMDWTKEEEAEG